MSRKVKKVKITGMSCASCARVVESVLREVEGVKDVKVNLANESAVIELEKDVSIKELAEKVEKAGYGVVLPRKSC